MSLDPTQYPARTTPTHWGLQQYQARMKFYRAKAERCLYWALHALGDNQSEDFTNFVNWARVWGQWCFLDYEKIQNW